MLDVFRYRFAFGKDLVSLVDLFDFVKNSLSVLFLTFFFKFFF